MKLKWKLPNIEKYPDIRFEKYLVDLIENNHTLIAGTVGSGKSVLENAIIFSLLCCKYPGYENTGNNANFILLDPKKVELRRYKNLPHCLGYADTPAEILSLLRGIRCEVDRRLHEMIKQGIQTSNAAPIYVFVDEMIDLVLSNESKQILRTLTDIISISRATNIFFIMLTQAPNRKILRPEIILNCNCRVALKCNSVIESRQIIDLPDAATLPEHGLAIVRKNIKQYGIITPFHSNAEINTIIEHWKKQHKFYMFFRNRK